MDPNANRLLLPLLLSMPSEIKQNTGEGYLPSLVASSILSVPKDKLVYADGPKLGDPKPHP